MDDRLVGDLHRPAVGADLSRHVVDDERALAVDDRVADRLGLVVAGASWALASHVVSSRSQAWKPPGRTAHSGLARSRIVPRSVPAGSVPNARPPSPPRRLATKASARSGGEWRMRSEA